MLNSLYLLVLSSLMFFNPTMIEYVENCKMEVSTNRLDSNTMGLEVFRYKTNCELTYSKTMVFNRWGSEVFKEANSNKGFDGTWKKKDLPDGSYFYKIEYKIKGQSDKLNISGYLQIVR